MQKLTSLRQVLAATALMIGVGTANAQTDTVFFNFNDSIVNWKVPCGVHQITITAVGATGGKTIGFTLVGGNGALMTGTFNVTPDSTIKILVGGAGQDGTGGGGGGGGTFVTDIQNNPLIIAGGGGGMATNTNGFIASGMDAVVTNNGVSGYSALGSSPSHTGVGGVSGNGATDSVTGGPCGGNGGGLLTDGASFNCCSLTTFGFAFVNGGAGGIDGGCFIDGQGGFGGGGSGADAGGGGYSGGGGSWDSPTNGGGGGSYNAGTAQTNIAGFNSSGNGIVIISYSVLYTTATVLTNPLCFGDNTGSAYAIVSNGTKAYTYSWTPTGGSRDTATGLGAGNYTVTVQDSCGNSVMASVVITEPNQLRDSISSHTNISCNGANNGSATVGVKGGTGSYTYLWAPGGETAASATGLSAGCYTVTVNDGNGCNNSAITCLTQPAVLLVTDSILNINCNGADNGRLKANVSGGTAAFTYTWSNGGSNNNITGLTAGSYTVTVTDANGCTGSATAAITQPPALSVVIDSLISRPCNSKLWAVVSGGTPGYNYVWHPSGSSADTIKNLCSGNYKLVVTDVHGCKDSITISIPTGVNELANNSNIHIYPVPASGTLNIDIKDNSFGLSEIIIFDITGRKVKDERTELNVTHIPSDVSKLDNGIYFLRLNGVNGSKDLRFEIIR